MYTFKMLKEILKTNYFKDICIKKAEIMETLIILTFFRAFRERIPGQMVISLSSQVVELACQPSGHSVIVKCIKTSSDQHQLVLIENI
jgi:hypothetical protein